MHAPMPSHSHTVLTIRCISSPLVICRQALESTSLLVDEVCPTVVLEDLSDFLESDSPLIPKYRLWRSRIVSLSRPKFDYVTIDSRKVKTALS